MKRRIGRLLVLVVVAIAAYLLVLGVHSLFGGGVPALAKRLPDDTLLWVSVRDTPSIVTALGGESTIGEYLDLLAEEEELLEFVEEYFGERLNASTAEKLAKWFAGVKAVDVVFNGIGIRHGRPLPKIVAMLEFRSHKAAESTRKRLGDLFPEKDNRKDAPVYRLDEQFADRLDDTVDPCIAVYANRLLFSLDTRTITNTIDMLRDGSDAPLAKNKTFRRLAKGTGKMSGVCWVGSDMVGELLDLVPRREQSEVRAVVRAAGLDEIEGLVTAGSVRTGVGFLRLGLAQDGTLARTFALAPSRHSFASLAPADAWFLGSVSTSDGEATWERLSDYLYGVMKATGEVDSRREFGEQMAELEGELGIGPEDVAQVVSDIGLFMAGGVGHPQFAVLFQVTDTKEAAALLEKVGKGHAFARREPRTIQADGQTIHVLARDFCYVVLENTVCLGDNPEVLASLARRRKSGQALTSCDGYRSVAGRLPKAAGARLFLDLGKWLEALGEDAALFTRLVEEANTSKRNLALGLALQTKGGVFEATSAAPDYETTGRLFTLGTGEALRDARDRACTVSDSSNLRQLSLGMFMYVQDYDGMYPSDLGLTYPYVNTPQTYRCPASGKPPAADEAAIRSGDCDYVYLKPARKESAVRRPSVEPMMMTRPGLLARNGVNVAYADGHVSWHSIDRLPETVRAALEKHFGPDWLRKLRAQ